MIVQGGSKTPSIDADDLQSLGVSLAPWEDTGRVQVVEAMGDFIGNLVKRVKDQS